MPGRANVVAVVGPRRGSGKTTVALGMAVLATKRGLRRATVVDLDPQCGASLAMLRKPERFITRGEKGTIAEAFEAFVTGAPPLDLSPAVVDVGPSLGLLPVSLWLEGWGERILEGVQRHRMLESPVDHLEEGLDVILQKNDLVVLDCGPGFGSLARIAMGIADEVVIALNLDHLAPHDWQIVIQEVRDLRRRDLQDAGAFAFHPIWCLRARPDEAVVAEGMVRHVYGKSLSSLPRVQSLRPFKDERYLDALALFFDPDVGL